MPWLSRLRFLAIPGLLMLAACASKPNDTGYVERPVETLYNNAMDQLFAGKYQNAAKTFDEVDQQHPYSVWATKAQIMNAYALYENKNYNASVVAAERFIQLHPGNPDTAYAYYLKALDYYIQIIDVQRDQEITRRALDALTEVVRRFPGTRYARDAKFKIDLCRDHLAAKDMAVGRFYERRGDYLAAINRFRTVVQKYQTTSHIAEALERLVECYYALGLNKEAERTAAVLGYNYPDSRWYKASYALLATGSETSKLDHQGRSWFARIVDPFSFF